MDYQSAGVDLQDQNMFNAKLTSKMPWLGGYAGAYDIGTDYLVSATDGVGTKIKLYTDADLMVYIGGTLFEAFIIRDMFEEYKQLLRRWDLTMCEVSDGSIEISHERKCDYIKELAKEFDGKISSFYLTLGQYDFFLICEFPSDEKAARFTVKLGSLGNIRTTTLKAFTEEEYKNIMER